MESIRALVEKENGLKQALKETRAEIKEEIEKTTLYKQVYEATMQSDYEVTEKTARAHAFRVVRNGFEDKDNDN